MLALVGALLLIDAAMVLIEVLPQRPSVGTSEIAHWRAELIITFAFVFIPGIVATIGAAILLVRSRRICGEEHTNVA